MGCVMRNALNNDWPRNVRCFETKLTRLCVAHMRGFSDSKPRRSPNLSFPGFHTTGTTEFARLLTLFAPWVPRVMPFCLCRLRTHVSKVIRTTAVAVTISSFVWDHVLPHFGQACRVKWDTVCINVGRGDDLFALMLSSFGRSITSSADI